MKTVLIFLFSASVAAQTIAPTPTLAPTPTPEPTTTYYPTATPTKAPIPAPVPDRPCYTDLLEIQDKVELKNPFLLETYILCPNTVFRMGVTDAVTYEVVNGSEPLLTRSNSIYQCGADGKSSNNCVFTGGDYQVWHVYGSHNNENKVNVVMKGLTFEDAKSGGLVVAAPGDITFVDCIFRNHENTGVMPILYSYDRTRRLKAITSKHGNGLSEKAQLRKYYHDILHDPKAFKKFTNNAQRTHQRLLQGGDILEVQKVYIDGCVFEDNRHGPDTELTIDGMIHIAAPSNELYITNTIFRNNSFTKPVDGGNGFAVGSIAGAKMTFSDVCFMDNEFVGSGVIVVEGSSEDFVSTNAYGEIIPDLTCAYASIGFESCVDYDRATCSVSSAFYQADVTDGAPVTAPVAAAAPTNEENTSGSTSIQMVLSIAVLSVSIVIFFFVKRFFMCNFQSLFLQNFHGSGLSGAAD